jgi:hypothetical protein
MPNHESLLQASYAPYPVSSSVTLDTLYRGRQLTVRVPRAGSQPREEGAIAPEAVSGQFNNYRFISLVGSVAVHLVLLGSILLSAIYGHHVGQQVRQRESVVPVAPLSDTYTRR